MKKNIKITTQITPFCVDKYSFVYLPKTTFGLKIYPTKIEVFDLSNSQQKIQNEIFIKLTGSAKKFKVFLDLKKERIIVEGVYKEGFIRYDIDFKNDIMLQLKRAQVKEISILLNNNKHHLQKGEGLPLPIELIKKKEKIETLSFGVHKKQDIDLINRRQDIKEILPLWFYLGQLVPAKFSHGRGLVSIFDNIEKSIEEKNGIKISDLFLEIYNTGFEKIFYPNIFDDKFQGVELNKKSEEILSSDSPLVLLSKGYEIIRRIFVQVEQEKISLLKNMFGLFPSGRLVNVKCLNYAAIDIEWTKKILKRVVILCKEDNKIILDLQKSIKKYRITSSDNDTQKIVDSNEPVFLKRGSIYYFDRFQK